MQIARNLKHFQTDKVNTAHQMGRLNSTEECGLLCIIWVGTGPGRITIADVLFKAKQENIVYIPSDRGSGYPYAAAKHRRRSVVENAGPIRMSILNVQSRWIILTGLLGLLVVNGQLQLNCSHPE